jgi:hypothetical protein
MSREGGMRILLALAVMVLVATPAFAGNKNKHEKNIDKLNEKIFETFVTPDSDRRQDLDRLEQKLAYQLFKLNH